MVWWGKRHINGQLRYRHVNPTNRDEHKVLQEHMGMRLNSVLRAHGGLLGRSVGRLRVINGNISYD